MAVTLEPALLAGDRALTERGVANLIDNALRHNVPDGTVRVTVATVDGEAMLTVANTGPVVPPGEVHRLLAPFQRGAERPQRTRSQTTAASDGGLGLGLPIVQAIATAHGAAFAITPRPDGGGLTAELCFPQVRAVPPGRRLSQGGMESSVAVLDLGPQLPVGAGG
jgi:signal transduction histidine kinase